MLPTLQLQSTFPPDIVGDKMMVILVPIVARLPSIQMVPFRLIDPLATLPDGFTVNPAPELPSVPVDCAVSEIAVL